jgi:low affinity Fe/Cu permease
MHAIRHALTTLGTWTASPWAFAIVLAYVAAWLAFDPTTFDWRSVVHVSTLLMTLVIQRAEHRDTQALHAKLDELLKAEHRADSELTKLDQKEPEEIEEHRSKSRTR